MIKVKKAWRKVEEDIVKACENLPPGIILSQKVFGYAASDEGTIIPNPNGEGKMCALGVRVLGANAHTAIGITLGVPSYWVIGFVNGFDYCTIQCLMHPEENDWRAGYQAGRRVAKKFGFLKGKQS